MKLFSNGYFQLDYTAANDIISLALPDMQSAGLSQAEQCFNIMLEHVKNYHVKNLLLDSSKAIVEVDDEAYHKLIYQVSMKLKETRLMKVARIASATEGLEKMAKKVQESVINTQPATYKIRNFTNKEEAMEWLTSNS